MMVINGLHVLLFIISKFGLENNFPLIYYSFYDSLFQSIEFPLPLVGEKMYFIHLNYYVDVKSVALIIDKEIKLKIGCRES